MSRHEQRRGQLRKLLRGKNAPSNLLVTNYTNVSYLTGFTGDDSYLLVLPQGEVLISDERYREQLADECPGLELVIRGPGLTMHEALAKVVKRAKVSELGIEAASVTVSLKEALEKSLEKLSFVSTNGLVEDLRMVKDAEEILQIRRAIAVAEKAFAVVRAGIRPQSTEKEIADEIDHQVRLFGGSGCCFPPIVGVGARASLPHGRPTNLRIEEAEFVLIDWGARCGAYISDLTRVLATAKISPKLERVHGVVLQAQLAAIAAIRPGAIREDVDAAARDIITKAGFGKQFGHSLGHGIGMNVHEAPRLATKQKEPLVAGMVITVEPGIYLPGWGGVRIEDDILVTRTGHEVLSSVPKTLNECVVM